MLRRITPKFSIKSVETNGVKTHHITWTQTPVNETVYNKITKWVRKSNDYAPMTSGKLRSFGTLVKSLNQKHNSSTTMEQAISIRNIILKDKIIKNFARMNQFIGKIAGEYKAGNGILALSIAYDFPPLNLLRGIFLHLGYDSSRIYSIFANKEDPSAFLNGRDLQQYNAAERNDAESTFNQQLIATIAAENENLVVDYFKSLGIKLTTQDELTIEQKEKYGRAVITPDILFNDRVYINNSRVHWIDYKDYIGTKVKFLYSSNVNQAAKYTAKWGPGAMCYHRSFVQDVQIPGALMLDATALPVILRDLK